MTDRLTKAKSSSFMVDATLTRLSRFSPRIARIMNRAVMRMETTGVWLWPTRPSRAWPELIIAPEDRLKTSSVPSSLFRSCILANLELRSPLPARGAAAGVATGAFYAPATVESIVCLPRFRQDCGNALYRPQKRSYIFDRERIISYISAMATRTRKKANSGLKYSLDQQVVYPLHGVGMIQTIEEREFQGKNLLYYIIYIDVSDMTVFVPVDKADDLGIRAIVSAKESKKALKLIGEDYEPVPTDWKLRYQMNLDLLKSGSVLDIATVVRVLYHRSKIKELPILERKLFDSALRLLIDEISFSINKGKEEVEELIYGKMEEKV